MRAASGRNKKNIPAYASSGFGYDAAGNRESATDQRGLVTAYVHNGFGEVIQQSSPDTGVTVYEYDSAGNRTRRTDARGVVTEWSYDALENSGDSILNSNCPTYCTQKISILSPELRNKQDRGMHRTLEIFKWVVLVGIALVVASCANLQTGFDAYNRGDYVTALENLRPLAEGGDADAQVTIGLMYKLGQGVPQDYAEAATWMHRAAKQGQSAAQGILGSMYVMGQGVPQDYVKAHAYYSVAGAQGQKDGFTARNGLEKLMAPGDIAEARRMASECAEKEYRGCEF